MQSQNIYTALQLLAKELSDIKTLQGKPCRIYLAYKCHALNIGISHLETLALTYWQDQHKEINDLLEQYRQEYNDLIAN